ncbi:MAG: manganese catalase family protein [Chloroflexota bacterium]|nr:manganese catalase family protein [Chloroflexota bacterium]
MFFHTKRLQYNAKPDRPAPMYAKMLQELVGGQFGEMSVMLQYLFQGWNCRGPAKYRDMLLDIGTEEMAHVEMLATMIARLLEGAPVEDQEQASQVPVVGAIMGGLNAQNAVMAGLNPQHLIVSGQGALGVNSAGVPWNAGYIVASGNLLADFRANLNAESQGRLQAVRLYEMTDDAGVRDMLSFLIARDTMHQNQWLAAIADLEAEGLEMTPVPSTFPQEREKGDVSYQFWNLSAGEESAQGRWAQGPSPDGKGAFQYLANPQPLGEAPQELPPADPRLHGTTKTPLPPTTSPGPATSPSTQG